MASADVGGENIHLEVMKTAKHTSYSWTGETERSLLVMCESVCVCVCSVVSNSATP